MKYVFYNIKNLAKTEKFILSVMLICAFVSAWIMTFSYGLYQNFYSLRTEGEAKSKTAQPQIADGEILTYYDIKAYLDALPDELLNGADLIMCMSDYYYENSETPGDMIGNYLFSRFTVKNGNYQSSPVIAEDWKSSGMIASGNFLSDNDEMFGMPSVMVRSDELTNSFNLARNKNLIIDDNTALIYGKEFNIAGTHTSSGLIVPFLALPGETEAVNFAIRFENTMTRKIYDELINTADEIIPGKLIFPELQLPDKESVYIYNNIMMISVFIAALTIINFAFLYNFIFNKRRRQISIMRLCGCTAARSAWICLGECIVICVPVFLAGMLSYIPFMHYFLSGIFEFMEDAYSPVIYAAIFIIYFFMLIIIMGILLFDQIGKTISESRKEGV